MQRKAYTPLMKGPFPAATDCSQDRPGWALFYLPAVQTIDQNIYATFNNMITHSDMDDPQDFPIYAPLQVSGAGKTKLCYTLAMDVGAIVIRFVRYTSNTDTPIYTIIERARGKMMKSNTAEDRLHFFKGAQKMVNLWVCAYIEFMRDFEVWCMLFFLRAL